MKWCWFLIFFIPVLPIQAHNIDVETYSENGALVIQVWLGEDPGEQVEIEIFTENGELRHSGQTQADGTLRWQPILEERLNLSVYAEPGHEKEIEIPKETVAAILSGDAGGADAAFSDAPGQSSISMPSTKKNRQSIGNILAGIGLIFAAAALWAAYRNQQKIKALEHILEKEFKHRER